MTEITTGGNSVERVETTKQVGDTAVHKETVIATEHVDSKELGLAKMNQFIWFIIHLIGVIIVLRFLFLLLDANLRGFSLFIYNLSSPFVAPFKGIFAEPRSGGSHLDSASLLALAIWYLLGYIVTEVLRLFSKRSGAEV